MKQFISKIHSLIFGLNLYLLGLENPASKPLYMETSAKVKKVVETTTLLLAIVTPICVIVPTFLANLIACLTTDMGAEDLELPLPKGYSNKFHTRTKELLNCHFYGTLLHEACGTC